MERNRRGAVVSGCAVAVLLALAPVSFANADPFKGCQVVKGRWGDGTTVSVEDQAVIPPRMRYHQVNPEEWANAPRHIGDCSSEL